ncbi:MAG: hypothetical protein MJK04_24325 [Psychrosphaera sp.]|nr:hypothetical protein [Psychrosphaera sp.]
MDHPPILRRTRQPCRSRFTVKGVKNADYTVTVKGGTTLEMLEFRDAGEQAISFSQSTLTWY